MARILRWSNSIYSAEDMSLKSLPGMELPYPDFPIVFRAGSI